MVDHDIGQVYPFIRGQRRVWVDLYAVCVEVAHAILRGVIQRHVGIGIDNETLVAMVLGQPAKKNTLSFGSGDGSD